MMKQEHGASLTGNNLFAILQKKVGALTGEQQGKHLHEEEKLMAKKILAVDDERHIVRLIQVNLERAGFTVITAFDGREALKKIADEKPDLVVLDVMMPYMNGLETLKQIRSNPKTRSLPVIMLTAKAQDQDVFQGYAYGVDVYLTKPFNPVELLTFVRRVFTDMDKDDDKDTYDL